MGKKDDIRKYILADDRMRKYKKQLSERGDSAEGLYWFITTHSERMRIKLAEYEVGYYTAGYIRDIFYGLIENEFQNYLDELHEEFMCFVRQSRKPYPTCIDIID